MKKLIFLCVFALAWGFIPLSAINAQSNGGTIYGDATLTLNYSAHRVEGFSIATADYTAGLNLIRRFLANCIGPMILETDLDNKYSVGSGSSVSAQVSLSSFNFVNGKTYCNYSQYFAIRRSTGQRTYYRLYSSSL